MVTLIRINTSKACNMSIVLLLKKYFCVIFSGCNLRERSKPPNICRAAVPSPPQLRSCSMHSARHRARGLTTGLNAAGLERGTELTQFGLQELIKPSWRNRPRGSGSGNGDSCCVARPVSNHRLKKVGIDPPVIRGKCDPKRFRRLRKLSVVD